MRNVWVALIVTVTGACGSPNVVPIGDDEVPAVPEATARAVELPFTTRGVVPERSGPPYPVVMAHGFFGFEAFAGVNQISYFYGVKDALAARGEKNVFTPAVDPFNDSAARGAALTKHVEEVIRQTGKAKVILFGHSQGGLDARVVAHDHPELVAAVVTFATPHRGSPLGDLAQRAVTDLQARAAIDALVRLVGGPLWSEAQKETSLFAALGQFAVAGIGPFNVKYTDAPGVPYFSFTGRSGMRRGADECNVPGRPAFITRWDDELDPTNVGLGATELYLEQNIFDPEPNDGLVTVSSAKWGTFLGCVPADHLDEIGQLFGARPGLFNDWGYVDFYAAVISMLRAKGL
ncbi:MAG: alpha/beta fold hydrolase [Myxococcaceae bacterium]|nr:alpha/beta fold hydrolase [Myxococcaceae bacterium]